MSTDAESLTSSFGYSLKLTEWRTSHKVPESHRDPRLVGDTDIGAVKVSAGQGLDSYSLPSVMTLYDPPDADTGTSAINGRAADMRQSTLQSTLPGALDGSFPSSYGVHHSNLIRPVGPLVGPSSCLPALLVFCSAALSPYKHFREA
ncbi:hypothetical protein ElyMa_000209900 [Elysia marginata]|uniref:Uncharacterized protein n=1 Tax=Elysia marginata TaxID=1093978 RepID=A0AAV4EYD2_9GAST|nr:hypothetical protein ElyMa_000209900 [Elysia marginata]